MNFSASYQEPKASISFRIDRTSRKEKPEEKQVCSPCVEWIRVAPNKIILASPDSSWLLEDHNNFHFTKSK